MAIDPAMIQLIAGVAGGLLRDPTRRPPPSTAGAAQAMALGAQADQARQQREFAAQQQWSANLPARIEAGMGMIAQGADPRAAAQALGLDPQYLAQLLAPTAQAQLAQQDQAVDSSQASTQAILQQIGGILPALTGAGAGAVAEAVAPEAEVRSRTPTDAQATASALAQARARGAAGLAAGQFDPTGLAAFNPSGVATTLASQVGAGGGRGGGGREPSVFELVDQAMKTQADVATGRAALRKQRADGAIKDDEIRAENSKLNEQSLGAEAAIMARELFGSPQLQALFFERDAETGAVRPIQKVQQLPPVWDQRVGQAITYLDDDQAYLGDDSKGLIPIGAADGRPINLQTPVTKEIYGTGLAVRIMPNGKRLIGPTDLIASYVDKPEGDDGGGEEPPAPGEPEPAAPTAGTTGPFAETEVFQRASKILKGNVKATDGASPSSATVSVADALSRNDIAAAAAAGHKPSQALLKKYERLQAVNEELGYRQLPPIEELVANLSVKEKAASDLRESPAGGFIDAVASFVEGILAERPNLSGQSRGLKADIFREARKISSHQYRLGKALKVQRITSGGEAAPTPSRQTASASPSIEEQRRLQREARGRR